MNIILNSKEVEKIVKDYVELNYCFDGEKAIIHNNWDVFELKFTIIADVEEDSDGARAEGVDSQLDTDS